MRLTAALRGRGGAAGARQMPASEQRLAEGRGRPGASAARRHLGRHSKAVEMHRPPHGNDWPVEPRRCGPCPAGTAAFRPDCAHPRPGLRPAGAELETAQSGVRAQAAELTQVRSGTQGHTRAPTHTTDTRHSWADRDTRTHTAGHPRGTEERVPRATLMCKETQKQSVEPEGKAALLAENGECRKTAAFFFHLLDDSKGPKKNLKGVHYKAIV